LHGSTIRAAGTLKLGALTQPRSVVHCCLLPRAENKHGLRGMLVRNGLHR